MHAQNQKKRKFPEKTLPEELHFSEVTHWRN